MRVALDSKCWFLLSDFNYDFDGSRYIVQFSVGGERGSRYMDRRTHMVTLVDARLLPIVANKSKVIIILRSAYACAG